MRYLSSIFVTLLFVAPTGCGVKGDPLPPEEPAYIGRGKPSFKKAVERFDIRTGDIEDEVEPKDADEDEEE